MVYDKNNKINILVIKYINQCHKIKYIAILMFIIFNFLSYKTFLMGGFFLGVSCNTLGFDV